MKYFCLFFPVLLFFSSCESDVSVTNVYLSQNVATLNIGDKLNLEAIIVPEGATQKTVSWESNKPSIASVDNNGQVTAIAKGTAVITTTTQDGNKTADCVVTVNDKIIQITAITLDYREITLEIGKTLTLNASIEPENVTNPELSWQTDNPAIAMVENGLVTAIGSGMATITVSSTDGSNKKAECRINVAWPDPVIVAYVTAGTSIMPDPAYLTHINYAFGEVNSSYDGIMINNENRLKSIAGLKENAPELKVLLAIGGWGKGGFSEMASTDAGRKAFASDCKRVIDEFNLDGVDMDWEYPTSSSAGITASPADKDNFTLLMGEIRKAIGDDKLLTFASSSTANYVDFVAVLPYVNFINIMTYDMGNPPNHQSALYPTSNTNRSCDESVALHRNAGIPMNKLTLGIPFFGHGRSGIPSDIAYNSIINLSTSTYTRKWDDVAKVPYMTNSTGDFVLTYDDPQSIAIKCGYIREKGMLGAMYWQYAQDDSNGSLRKAVFNGLKNK